MQKQEKHMLIKNKSRIAAALLFYFCIRFMQRHKDATHIPCLHPCANMGTLQKERNYKISKVALGNEKVLSPPIPQSPWLCTKSVERLCGEGKYTTINLCAINTRQSLAFYLHP